MQFEIVIFTFNRSKLLDNCLKSVLSCAPGAGITIVDDGSTDLESRAFLDGIRYAEKIRTLSFRNRTGMRLGNLHANMRSYFEECAESKYIMFLQDDAQLVRRLKHFDYIYIQEFFEKFSEKAFLYPMFNRIKKPSRTYQVYLDSSFPVWFRQAEGKYSGFSDICIFRPDRLRAVNFTFGDSEEETAGRAAAQFGSIGEMPMPFVAFVPAPITHRFQSESIVYKKWARKNTGVFPIQIMEDRDVEKMKKVLPFERPVMQEFLSSPSYIKGHPWPVFRMQNAPKMLRWLDRLEVWLRGRLRIVREALGRRSS